MAIKPYVQRRELSYIALYVTLMIILGLSKETTIAIFPELGAEVYKTINFYFVATIALMATISWLIQSHDVPRIPPIPPLWAVTLNFIIFFPITYILIAWFLKGSPVFTIPLLAVFIIQAIISFNENFIAFILFPTLHPWGSGVGSHGKGTIFTIRDYSLKYDIPTWNRIKFRLPSIILITFLHLGAYSLLSSNIQELYSNLTAALFLFTVMAVIYETFGFGAGEAGHVSWNLNVGG